MDFTPLIADITAALDKAYALAGLPSLTQQLGDAQATVTDLQNKIATARAAAQADKDADDANVAGQAVLDALGP